MAAFGMRLAACSEGDEKIPEQVRKYIKETYHWELFKGRTFSKA